MSASDLLNDVLVDVARTATPVSTESLTASLDSGISALASAQVHLEQLAAENTVLRRENIIQRQENLRLRELVACYRSERHAR